jgi:5-(carboxyamino)imidazole ribonucleotide synthase
MQYLNNNYFSSNFTLGILGGGQLGKMMLTEIRKFDIKTYVLDPSPDAPAQYGAHQFFMGDLMDFETVYQFGKKVDLLTIEIENVNIDALLQLENEGLTVYPSPKTLQLIQSKAIQKKFYLEHQIPTSKAQFFKNLEDLKQTEINFPSVWKAAQFGYDGNGVKVLKTKQDIENLPNSECIIEEFIPFENELAVIVVRNSKGEIKTYPVVEMEFHPEANQVEYVICPARIPVEIAQKANEIALKVSEKYNHVGILAVEMFLTKDQEILVNEVAPRPHNSGHYSIEASFCNQFENHIRAILGLPLGDTSSKIAGVMVNLVGAEGFTGNVKYENIEQILSLKGVTPHIYGKKTTKPFRKMGHITIVNPNINEARKIAETVKNSVKVISQ